MSSNQQALRLTLAAIWFAVICGSWWILRQNQIGFHAAFGAAVALWIEASLYTATAFPAARNWFAAHPHKAHLLALSVLPSFLFYGVGVHWATFIGLILAATVLSFWFTIVPDSDFADLGFIALIAFGLLAKPFGKLFPPLSPNLRQAEFIGHLMWIRLAFWALLGIRKRSTAGFGFLPSTQDWLTGTRLFLYSIPAFAFLLWILNAAQLKQHLSFVQTPLILIGTFIGILWVVALSEDFLTQGIFLPIMTRWTGSTANGLVITSICFGMVHLSYRRFPNWKMVLLAGILGTFLSKAAQATGSIRASMVTHSLAVAVFRTFFSER